MVGSILTLNAGSSSLKFALFDTATGLKARVHGEIEDLDAAPHLLARDTDGSVLAERRWPAGTRLPPSPSTHCWNLPTLILVAMG